MLREVAGGDEVIFSTSLAKLFPIADDVLFLPPLYSSQGACAELKMELVGMYFFADVDLSIGLGLMKDLKRFKILNPESPFFVEDGLLYANVDAGRYESRIEALESDEVETECKERQKELCRRYTIFEHLEGYESLCGKVLCSIPPAISKEEIVIPEGVVGICSGAVLNCDLKRLSLPNSLKCVGSLAIQSSQIKELIVSNRVFDTSLNLVDESQIGKVSRRDSTEPLDEEVVEKWLDVFDSDDIQSELSRLIL